MTTTKTFFVALLFPLLILSACSSESPDDDDKYTCWVVDEKIKTCDPAKISEYKDLNVVIKKAGSFCKSRALFSAAHKAQVEARGVNTSPYLRSTDYRCVWGDVGFDDLHNDGCKVSGTLERSGNKRTLITNSKSCGKVEPWDKKGNVLYGIVDEAYAQKICEPFIRKIPMTQVDQIEILPVDVAACEKFSSKADMLAAYNTLIKSDVPHRRHTWKFACAMYAMDKSSCFTD
jgi:hypothetical protein